MPLILKQQLEPSISLLTLNRPEKRNALNIPLLEALVSELESLRSTQRAIIINGAGPVFCSGLDLSESTQLVKEETSANLLAKLYTTIYEMPSLTIGAVHGAALGGGIGLACACDYVFAAPNTRFGFPEVQRGLVPAQVAGILRRQVSQRKMRELLLFGDNIEADEALRIGLINQIVAPEDLLNAAVKIAKQGLKGAPQAIHRTKVLMEALSIRGIEDDLDIAMDFHHKARHSGEAREGIQAFLEKRKPAWDNSLSD